MKVCCLAVLLLLRSYLTPAQEKPADTLLIHFDYNKSVITPEAAVALDSLVSAVALIRIQRISLYGHCDFIGSHPYNDSLSRQRVQATQLYLISKGLSDSLFSETTGMGKRQPLVAGSTDAARTANRRVEIILVKQAVAPATSPKEAMAKPVPSVVSEMLKDSSVKEGSKLVLPNLHFEGGQHLLLPPSYPILRDLLKAMQDNPNLVIEIQGHICCMQNGADGLDWGLGSHDLSVQRAKAIYNFLAEQGIAKSRMSYKGFGSSQKLFPAERTPEEEAKNRRVEIKIIRK